MVDAIAVGKTAGVFKVGPRAKAVVKGGAGTAARVAELLGGVFTWAERRGLVMGANGGPFINPVHGVERVRGEPRTRVLNEDAELRALGRVLAAKEADVEAKARRLAAQCGKPLDPATALPPPPAAAVTRLVALSGWRRTEWSTLQWAAIDWNAHCIRLGDERRQDHTKNGRWNRAVGDPVLLYLKRLALTATSDKWVFPNRDRTGSADVKKAVGKLFDAAGLSDARSHDLRRTFSTIGDDLGYSEATIGMLIGDAPRRVVMKHYIHKPDPALVAAADRISKRIAAALDDEPAVEVIDLEQRRAAS